MAIRTDILKNGYKIIQNDKAFCFGIDAVLLAAFTKIKKGDLTVDLGTGNGILPLLLCGKSKELKSSHTQKENHFIGIELQEQAVKMASESVAINCLQEDIEIKQGNLCNIKQLLPSQCANVVVSNPPYMKVEAAKANSTDEKTIARHEVFCTIDNVISAAAYLLKSNGSFYIIHRPYRLTEIFASMEKHHLTPRRMQLVYPSLEASPEMVLIEARPNYKPDLKIENPLIMYSGSEYTESFKAYCNL